jgi:hypothetical protein
MQNILYYIVATCEDYKYQQHGIRKMGMITYYDKVLKEENTAGRFPSFKNEDSVQNLVPRMSDDLAHDEWKLPSLEHMKLNDNYKCPIIH